MSNSSCTPLFILTSEYKASFTRLLHRHLNTIFPKVFCRALVEGDRNTLHRRFGSERRIRDQVPVQQIRMFKEMFKVVSEKPADFTSDPLISFATTRTARTPTVRISSVCPV